MTATPDSQGQSSRSWYKRNEIAVTPWLFLIPGIFFFMVYVIIPVFQSFQISLYEWDGISPWEEAEFVGLEHYERLFGKDQPRWERERDPETGERVPRLVEDPETGEMVQEIRERKWDRNFRISLLNNVKWLILYLLAIPIGLFIALFLNQTVWGIRFYKSMFFFPFVISQVVVGLVFTWFYLPAEGLLSQFSQWLGFGKLNILGNADIATYGVIAAGLWPQTAYCMILYLTGLNAVDPEQVEAGRLDGAKGRRMLWHVVLPQLKPATFIAFVVTIIGALRSFDFIDVMTEGGPSGSTRVLSFYMFQQILTEPGTRWGFGSAISVVLFAIMLVFIAYFLWSMWREEREGR